MARSWQDTNLGNILPRYYQYLAKIIQSWHTCQNLAKIVWNSCQDLAKIFRDFSSYIFLAGLYFSTFISIGIMNLDQTNHIYHNIANTLSWSCHDLGRSCQDPTMILPRSHHGPCQDLITILPRFYHNLAMILHNLGKIPPWSYHDHIKILPRSYCNLAMILEDLVKIPSWSHHDPRFHHDFAKILSKSCQYPIMILPWSCQDPTMILPN
jgi:hypothetical protein